MPHNDENWLNGKIGHIKRTEQDILNDFEKFGWKVSRNDEICLTLRFENSPICTLWIDKNEENYFTNTSLNMQEHKLLTDLFECWGWF